MFKPFRSSVIAANITWLPLIIALGYTADGSALEELTVHELVIHCQHLKSDPGGMDGQYCIRYIQGFIDGAVETDERIVQNMGSANDGKSTLSERAKRTRMSRHGVYNRPGSLAGFCLGDPVRLHEIVDTVVTDLVSLDIGNNVSAPARVAVDDALRRHYPCSE